TAVGTHSANAILGQDFVFEGYRVWQLPSKGGFSNAKVIATYDIANGYDNLYSDLFNPQIGGTERLRVVQGPNEGLKFQFNVTTGDTLAITPGDDTGFTSPVVDGFIATVTPAPNNPSLIHQLLRGSGLLGAADSLNMSSGDVSDSSGTVLLSNYVSPYDINNFNFQDNVHH